MDGDADEEVTVNSLYSLSTGNIDKDVEFKLGTLYGKEHPWFWRVHITALVSLGTSIIFSAGTLIFLIRSGKDCNIFKRKFSERLVVYLAVADILYSFMLVELFLGQGIIITITALSAFVMVVLNRKITFGRNDWALLVCSFGIPAVPSIAFAALGWFGPTGFWCMTDYSTTGGPIIALFYSLFQIGVAAIITVCYLGVWITIQVQMRRMSHFNEGEKAKEERKKYQKTAQVLTLFIVSYIAQWLAWIVYCIWSFITIPPDVIINLVACTANMGGVFNFFAYTFVRRFTSQRRDDRNDVTSSTAPTVSTMA